MVTDMIFSATTADLDAVSVTQDCCSEIDKIQGIWRSVITQALMDAASNSHKKSAKAAKIRALEWLQGESDDFTEVCLLADMDPQWVREQAAGALRRGCKWRNDLRQTVNHWHNKIDLNFSRSAL